MKDKLAAQEVTAKRTMANMQSEHKAQMDQVNIKQNIINCIYFKTVNEITVPKYD